eukprot:CAMPEP_0204185886 /NCGR_PEP_ID=MMETSP0361-20130328/55669_1 /ASSEMBLY_ACC=CAM_ASM_000343 /TAXON_ID=268821 /ORGANISM="Scrippsiella Hangoei, Strain SHTV-5" /LENGTH=638 /DNA_ID=CAMNT_0051146153 /DNA_START=1 /DNA_END=1917 /DNA_ORIENTATION=-
MAMADPCEPFRSSSRRGLTRACYGAIWAAQCTTEYWREHWHSNSETLAVYTYEEAIADVRNNRHHRCWPHSDEAENCQVAVNWLDFATSMAFTGFLPERSRVPLLGDEEFVDMVEATRFSCPVRSMLLRLLLQRMPQVLTNSSRRLAHIKMMHVGVPINVLRQFMLSNSFSRLVGQTGLFGPLKTAAEAPWHRELDGTGLAGVDECAKTGREVPSPQDFELGRTNSSSSSSSPRRSCTHLLATFYRQRDPGLDHALTKRWLDAASTADADADDSKAKSLMRVSALLAQVDLLRNLGDGPGSLLKQAGEELRAFLRRTTDWDSWMLPSRGPPQHLVFHFLDKLSLQLVVDVVVDPPNPMPSEDMLGRAMGPAINQVKMSVLPDRDIISDHIRRTGTFHCPFTFKQQLLEAAAQSFNNAGVSDGEVLRVVEVGGFLGDCILWATAWLGPSRIRALEVEPVGAATSRFRESVARNGFSDSVEVRTEPLGDGGPALFVAAAGGGGAAPANPNYYLTAAHGRGGGGTSGDESGVPRSVSGGAALLRPRALDEVLLGWGELPEGAFVDFVRVKASGFEALIVAGLHRHLAARRVRRLFAETGIEPAKKIKQFMSQWPDYELDERWGKVAGHALLVYRLHAGAGS